MSPALTSPSPTTLTTDLPCNTCNYNLKTLPTTTNCPECGTPVAQTLNNPKPIFRFTLAQIAWASVITIAAAASLHVDLRWLAWPIPQAPWMWGPYPYYTSHTLAALIAYLTITCFIGSQTPASRHSLAARTTHVLATLYVVSALIGTFIRFADGMVFQDSSDYYYSNNSVLAWAHFFEGLSTALHIATMLATFWFIKTLGVTFTGWMRRSLRPIAGIAGVFMIPVVMIVWCLSLRIISMDQIGWQFFNQVYDAAYFVFDEETRTQRVRDILIVTFWVLVIFAAWHPRRVAAKQNP